MDQSSNLLKQRRDKANLLAESGVKLFRNDFKSPIPIVEILPRGELLTAESYEENGNRYRVAGRIMSMRKFGKAAFFHVQDETGRIQIYAKRDLLGDEEFKLFKKWDVGDIVGIEGRLFKTKTGELSVEAAELCMITKSMRPLPEKFHGLTDVETRYRQRYVDLIVNPEVKETFRKRVDIIRIDPEHPLRFCFQKGPGDFIPVEIDHHCAVLKHVDQFDILSVEERRRPKHRYPPIRWLVAVRGDTQAHLIRNLRHPRSPPGRYENGSRHSR